MQKHANGYLLISPKTKDDPMPHHLAGLSWTASGYGKKIPTRRKCLFNGRWYRVYATCYSNAASCWFVSRGVKYYLS